MRGGDGITMVAVYMHSVNFIFKARRAIMSQVGLLSPFKSEMQFIDYMYLIDVKERDMDRQESQDGL